VAGAAYAARLVPIRLIGGNAGDDQEAKAMAHRLDLVHISNNSWGADDDGKTITSDKRLRAVVPTLKFLKEQGAKVFKDTRL
jgi:3-phosphoglycerate kinase